MGNYLIGNTFIVFNPLTYVPQKDKLDAMSQRWISPLSVHTSSTHGINLVNLTVTRMDYHVYPT